MQSKHNSKIKKHLTRALSLMLAFALALSTPLTTHAGVGDSGDNTGGGAGGMSGSTSALAWSQNHQGYRIYVINSDFVRISPTYDFLYSTPSQIGPGNELYTTRFDGPASPTNHYKAPITKLQEWCDSSSKVPTPTKLSNGNRIGNGQEFKDWFFAGRAGTSIDTGNGSGSGNTGGNTTNPTNQNYPKTTLVQKLNMTRGEFMAEIDWYNNVVRDYNSGSIIEGVNNQINVADWYVGVSYYELLLEEKNFWYDIYKSDIGKWFDINGDGVGDYQLTESALNKYCAALGYEEQFNWDWGGMRNPELGSLGCYIYILGKEAVLRSNMDILDDNFRRVNEQLSYYSPATTQSLLFQSIPLAGEEGEAGTTGPSPAANLVNKNNTIQVPAPYTCAGDALQDGCYLVVEPITWLYVRVNNGPWDSPSTYESTRTYGTYWNLASKWVGTGGFYNTIMTKLFNNCLAISRTVTSPTGKTLQGIESTNQKSVADSLNYMNAGYGLSMHIYDSSDFASSTSTYDEPLGSTPGKAPDDSDQLPEADRTNTAKYANIVKFYESENSVTINNQTATQISRDSFTRTPSPKTIF